MLKSNRSGSLVETVLLLNRTKDATKTFSFILILIFALQFVGTSWDELRHIRQAVGFLVCELVPK